MKITLEPAMNDDPEIIIRGNPDSPRVRDAISLLSATPKTGKLFLYKDEKAYLSDFTEITYFEANNNKVFAHTDKDTLETKHKLYELAEMLRPKGFIQINKGIIININYVLSVEAEFSGNYTAILKNNSTLTISRKYIKEFRKFVMEEC